MERKELLPKHSGYGSGKMARFKLGIKWMGEEVFPSLLLVLF